MTRTSYHWHSLSVSDITFTQEGIMCFPLVSNLYKFVHTTMDLTTIRDEYIGSDYQSPTYHTCTYMDIFTCWNFQDHII